MSEFIEVRKAAAHKIAAAVAFDLRKEVKTNFRGCRDDTAMAAADVIDGLMQQRAELLEALKKSKELREVERMMAAIERTRNRGNYGIAVAEDGCAKEWQSLRKDADFLRSVIDEAITKAEAAE